MPIPLHKRRWLRKFAKRYLSHAFRPFFSQDPAAQLIRKTGRQQMRLLATNVGCSLVAAFSEGATLAVIFLAVEVLTAPVGAPFSWAGVPILGGLPWAAALLSDLPTGGVFVLLLLVAVLLQALQSVSSFGTSVSIGYFAARCASTVKSRVHSQVLQFSFPCASGYKIGDLANYAGVAPLAVETQISAISNLLVNVLMALTYTAVLVRISPLLLVVVVAIGGVVSLLQRRLQPLIAEGSSQLSAIEVAISQKVIQNFQALRLLHTSGQLDEADQQLKASMGKLEKAKQLQTRRMSLLNPISRFLPILAIALVASLSMLLLGGRNSNILPSLATFVVALQRLNIQVGAIGQTFNTLAANSGRMQRLNEILSPQGKQFRGNGGTPFNTLQREIRLEAVGLQYSPGLPPALRDISFSHPRGQTLALVGSSGAGKSSIADLLTGLYSPTSGQIWIDDIPLDQLEMPSWQQRLGVVSQDIFLFNATIAENVAFGTPWSTPAQIEAACQAAQAAEFIEGLPEGYDTLVGERGYRLSGGQRQRLSLARAIQRNPELLILDEATSALDSQSERLVQEAIERFERNHTVLVIAHRLSTIVNADQILVLDRGQIIEQGQHAKLLAQNGVYSGLWREQTGVR